MEGVIHVISSMLHDWRVGLTLIVCIVTAVYFYATRNFGYFKALGLDNPRAYPFLGSGYTWFTPTAVRETMTDLVKKHGKVFGMFSGSTPEFVFAESSYLKEVLVKQFDSYTDHRVLKSGSKYVDRNLVNLSGDDWRRVRHAITPTFTPGKIKNMIGGMIHCSKEMVNDMTGLMENKKNIVDMKEIAGNFTMDVVARTMFGVQLKKEDDSASNEFVKNAKMIVLPETFGIQTFLIMLNVVFPKVMRFLELFGLTTFPKQCLGFFCGLVDDLVSAREKVLEERNDFLAFMVKSHKIRLAQESNGAKGGHDQDITKKGLDRIDVIASGFVFFIGGFATLSAGLSASVYYLADNVEWQQKVYEEIESVLTNHKGEIDAEVFNKMPLLDMCIKESLRLSPAVPMMDRVATKDNIINGLSISKGTQIWIPVHAIHHDPDYFPEPEKFDPLRFTDEGKASRPNNVYQAFGTGSRACIGEYVAYIVLKTGLIHLLRKFKFDRSNCEEPIQCNNFGVARAMVSFQSRSIEC